MANIDWQRLVFEAEQYLIPKAAWLTCGIPAAGLEVIRDNMVEGCPTGVANHPVYGWLVLSSAGQGPCIDWYDEARVARLAG